MYKLDPTGIDSDKQFRIPITEYLRSIGISQIIGTKEYLEIESNGGEGSVMVPYSFNLDELHE